MATLPLRWNPLHKFCLFLSCILTPSPNHSMFCFNQFYKQFIVSLVYISCIVNIWWEIPLERVEGQFSLRKWFCWYPGAGLPQPLGSIPMLTKWCRYRGLPGMNDKDFRSGCWWWTIDQTSIWLRNFHLVTPLLKDSYFNDLVGGVTQKSNGWGKLADSVWKMDPL